MRKGTRVVAQMRTSEIGLMMQPNVFIQPYLTQTGRVQRIKPHKYLDHVVEYPDGFRLSFHKADLKRVVPRRIKVRK